MTSKQNILLLGGTGFVGNELGIILTQAGYNLHLVTRNPLQKTQLAFPCRAYAWNADGSIPDEAMTGVDTIVNLAGESIATGRWTKAKKKSILQSRVKATQAAVAAANKHKIATLIQSSAIGYYGSSSEPLDENAPAGEGFLASTAQAWEGCLTELDPSIRSVTLRLGVVLGTTGGAFLEILNPYIMGVGASIGSHAMSWIHIDDVTQFIKAATEQPNYTGIYNLTAPNACTYKELHAELTHYYGGFSWLQAPKFVFKIALGEKSTILLDGQQVLPARALAEGFSFRHLDIKSCLQDLLGKTYKDCGVLHMKQWIKADEAQVWDFFSSEKNLETITPPFLNFKVVEMTTPKIEEGSEIVYKLRLHGLPIKWRTKILNFTPKTQFVDLQLKGPYNVWHHTHNFHKLGDGIMIEDYVKYKLPFGLPGKIGGFPLVKRDVQQIFGYRKKIIGEIFASS